MILEDDYLMVLFQFDEYHQQYVQQHQYQYQRWLCLELELPK
jgi:hypothetical protein